ncbi:10526_t:CDS:2 [Dentiscutata erythropus]|uniref:10526_t:CDS:1 n=1 Tax=Dentiscutata erythropus TaxID=1348616 RepID=A0A9N9EFU1_9GLOM|nr:10526_t:CDS:2 [Dentiscutata erythropus]
MIVIDARNNTTDELAYNKISTCKNKIKKNPRFAMNKDTEWPRKKRMTLTIKTKQEICQRKNETPFLTIDELSSEYNCDRSTISKILSEKDKWLTMQLAESQEEKKVNRLAKFMELENAIDIWVQKVLLHNGILTDGILQRKNLGVEYDASQNAWMTTAIFDHWIKSLNASCRLKCKKILLLIDGASSHSKDQYSHIKVHILPAHTTPYL